MAVDMKKEEMCTKKDNISEPVDGVSADKALIKKNKAPTVFNGE